MTQQSLIGRLMIAMHKEIKAEMKASALNKNAQGYQERFSYKVVEFSPTTEGVI